MTSEMTFECLLVCRDPSLYSTLTKILHDLSISVDHCLNSTRALEVITKGTHDLVLIDSGSCEPSELRHEIWGKRKKPTVVVISDDRSSVLGAHFTLRKPATRDSATECLRSAYSRMLLEYRLNARYAILAHLQASCEDGRLLAVTVTDIGDNGIGLKSGEALAVGRLLSLSLPLHEVPFPLHMQVRVIWTRDYGVAGAEIVNIPPVDREILREWLKKKMQVKKPLAQPEVANGDSSNQP